jgi:hypothetical protein
MSEQDPVQRRESFLPMMLATFVAGFFCLVMIILTGGFFFYLCGVVVGMVLLGMLHYILWGRAMEQQVESHREEYELLEKAKEKFTGKGPDWTYRR